ENTGIKNEGAIGDGGTSGATVFRANTMNLDNGTVTTTGGITVKPYSAGTSMGIGSGAGALSIDDTALASFTWGGSSFLKLGDGAAGAMDINSAVVFAHPVEFHTQAGSDITQSGQLKS